VWQPPSEFRLLDSWQVPIEGGRDEFPAFAKIFIDNGFQSDSRIAAALFRVRWWLGKVFGWDQGPEAEPHEIFREPDRVVLGLRNKTIEGMIDLTWVEASRGKYTARFSIYVRYVSRLSGAYMALIKPFRHAFVYPPWMKRLKRLWESR